MGYKTEPTGEKIIAVNGVSPTVVLTAAQWQFRIIVFQGGATGSPIVQVPNGVADRIINNQVAVSIDVKTAGGTVATIPAAPNGNKIIWVDSSQNVNIVV